MAYPSRPPRHHHADSDGTSALAHDDGVRRRGSAPKASAKASAKLAGSELGMGRCKACAVQLRQLVTAKSTVAKYSCGYVDPNWHVPSGKRSAAEEEAVYDYQIIKRSVDALIERDGKDLSTFAAREDYPADTPIVVGRDGQIQRREIVERGAEPLVEALKLVGFAVARQTVQKERGHRLKGYFPADAMIAGIRFDKGAACEIRYDFVWWGKNKQPPTSDIFGVHVKLLVQDAFNRQAFAFYYPEDSFTYKTQNMDDVFYAQVVKVLTDVAGYAQYAYAAGKDAAARLFNHLLYYTKDEL
ncbi:MAG: hypothetical protein M1832_001556 [Thelocarpon impressellum]|nr:MAG: hypothetical protein M1832_001556 [Thelocarpon impressellum]